MTKIFKEALDKNVSMSYTITMDRTKKVKGAENMTTKQVLDANGTHIARIEFLQNGRYLVERPGLQRKSFETLADAERFAARSF